MMATPKRRFILFLLTTVILVWLSGFIQREVRVFGNPQFERQVDFAVYYTAALVARSDTDRRLYSIPAPKDSNADSAVGRNPQLMKPDPTSTYARFDQISRSHLQYLYPPPFAVMMVPFTLLSYELARIVWHIALTAFLFFGVYAAFSIFVRRRIDCAFFAILAVSFFEFTLPMQDLLMVGNVGTLMLFLCALGVATLDRSPILSAFAFALATCIKVTPIVVLPVMFVQRKWKWCIAYVSSLFCISISSILVVGLNNHLEFAFSVMPAMSQGVPVTTNASFITMIYSTFAGTTISPAVYPEGVNFGLFLKLTYLFKIIAFLVYLSMVIVIARKQTCTEVGLAIAVVAVLLWSVPFSPVSWRHSYVVTFLPIIVAWMLAYRERWKVSRLCLLAMSSSLLLSILPSYLAAATGSFAVDFVAFSAMPMGAVLLLMLLFESLLSQWPGVTSGPHLEEEVTPNGLATVPHQSSA